LVDDPFTPLTLALEVSCGGVIAPAVYNSDGIWEDKARQSPTSSRSEGVSQTALEALHLGVHCVLRDLDGNADLLAVPASGALFVRDENLAPPMLQAAEFLHGRSGRNSLLPQVFQQIAAASQYLNLLEHSI
jgi:hypothetical protein